MNNIIAKYQISNIKKTNTDIIFKNLNKIHSIIFILILLVPNSTYAIKNNNPHSQFVKKIYGTNKDEVIRIPPPDNFLLKSGQQSQTQFKVKYNNFPAQAKIAFNYALDIWASLLNTNVTINIYATWEDINAGEENGNTLAAAGATDFFKDHDAFPNKGVYYNIVLAEKFNNKNLNIGNDADIYIEFNSKTNWYFGTDGETPSGKYDLVTVVLHEICHGLGFYGSMTMSSGNSGSWGYGAPFPFSFDRFVYNGSGQQLINTAIFANPSINLGDQYISQNLFFSGPVVLAENGEKVALYAPSKFSAGSSIDHLSTSFNSTPHRLMTPGIGTASSIHDPGILTMAILKDVGWSTISINHQPLTNTETIQDIRINADITSDPGIEIISPEVFYSVYNNDFSSIPLNFDPIDSLYFANIAITDPTEIKYYIKVTDQYKREYLYPNTAPYKTKNVSLGPDTIAPLIAHIPNKNIYTSEIELKVQAEVSDIYGIKNVYIEYFYNKNTKNIAELNLLSENTYNINLVLDTLNLKSGDVFNYRIIATDKSISGNQSFSPDTGFFSLLVKQIPEFVNSYETYFLFGINDFKLNNFEIKTAKGFGKPALQSEHPYLNGGENTWLDFTAELIFPVKIELNNHYISFDEIALIEPGEIGSKFGDDDFYDYVIVEGSKDNGQTWLPFEFGWDCRLHNDWIQAYNQSQYFDNFETLYQMNLFRNHQIDLTASGDFKPDDVIIIRFRLHSDPYAVGWGWAIDNLKIQTKGLISPNIKQQSINISPNPINNKEFSINGINEEIKTIKVFNTSGKLIFQQSSNIDKNKISIPEFRNDIYILYIQTIKKQYSTKLIVNNNFID